jgi:signal transduction histidine kinase
MRWRPFRRFGLPERLLAILLFVIAIDFAANTVVFNRAGTFALHEDDAARIAENLVLVSRILDRTPVQDRGTIATSLSTERLKLGWTANRSAASAGVNASDTLEAQVVHIAPELAGKTLSISAAPLASDGNVRGSLKLGDGSVVRFRTFGSHAWELRTGLVFPLLIPTLVLAVLAWLLFSVILRPLRQLIAATRRVGSGPPRELEERGPDEVRVLIRAFNQMQQRIHCSLQARAQSMMAICHDLRTPLARLQLRIENIGMEDTARDGLMHDIEEMDHLLQSLQAYVDAGGKASPAERIDLAVMASTLVDTVADQGADATYAGEDSLEVMARPVSIRRAISNLIENAVHYAGNVRVFVRRQGGDAVIMVEDDGPGIPEARMHDVQQPFVRLDTARARDTPGMGLGLSIVRRAAKIEGAILRLENRAEGGLRVTIVLSGAVVGEEPVDGPYAAVRAIAAT